MLARSPFRVVGVAIFAALLPTAFAENPKAAKVAPTYIDDIATLDHFTEKLGALVTKGKCLSPDDVKAKTETDHAFALKTTPPGTSVLAPEDVYKKLLNSVYIIGCVKKTDDADVFEDGWFATAWALTDDGVLMTNWHVFEKVERAYFGVANAKGDVFPVIDILACDKKADIAIVRVSGTGFTPLAVAAQPAEIGTWVGVLSHPGNQPFTFTQGAVTRYTKNFGGLDAIGERWMSITADYGGGSSGGPVVNRFGAVVGMACMTSNIDHEDDVPTPIAIPEPKKETQKFSKKRTQGEGTVTASQVQMVVKLAVPVTPIRRITGEKDDAEQSTDEIYAEMKARFEKAETKLSKQIEDAKSDLLAELLTSERDSLMALYAKGLARLALVRPAEENVPAMLNDVLKYSEENLEQSLEILIKYHAASDAFAEGIMNLEATPPKNLAAFLKAIIAKNKDANSLGAAHYTLGLFAKHRAKSGDEAARAEAAEHLAIVVAKYADANPDDEMDALGKRAAKALAGVKNLGNLVVGKVAPEIRGKDLDGKPMKLSDFRGKVVLVDFWATWSGASVAQIPHNRELLATHKDKPFAIVGINADEVDEELFTALEKNKVNWRSFQNRPEDSEVEIADEWNVTALPTLYLLDAKGKIRKIWETTPDKAELDAEIEKLLAEAGK